MKYLNNNLIIFLFIMLFPLLTHAASEWEVVGTAGFTNNSANGTSLTFDSNDTPYLVFGDADNSNRATVVTWNGTSWETLGTPGFTPTGVFSSPLQIAIDSTDTPYVAFKNSASTYKASVMKYDGDSWVLVGPEGITPTLPPWMSMSHSFAIGPTDNLYVAYGDNDNSSKASVIIFDGDGWIPLGSAGFSAGAAGNMSIDIDSTDTPYIFFADGANSNKGTVMYWDGDSWEILGAAGFSDSNVLYGTIAIDSSDTPYVAYKDPGNSNQATVMKYNGAAWEVVGTKGFSAGASDFISITFDSNDTPYVVYRDGGNGNNATLMTYNGTTWEDVGLAGFSVDSAGTPSLAINSEDVPYVGYQDSGNLFKATVQRFVTEEEPTPSSTSSRNRTIRFCSGDITSFCRPQTTFTSEPTPEPTTTTCPSPLTEILKQGSRGLQVSILQNILKITSDGIFGPLTKQAVQSFQQTHTLTPDGIVGPLTRSVLNEEC